MSGRIFHRLVSATMRDRAIFSMIILCSFTEAFAQPANDDPCGAVNLPVNAVCANTAGTIQNSTTTAGIPNPGCGYANTKDVWYKITVPVNGCVTINTTANAIADGAMAVYSATACNGVFTLISCNDDQSGGNTMPKLDLTCLTAGAVIYIRFWRASGNGNTFNICATTLIPAAAPANDDPCGAVLLPVNVGCVNTAGTTVGACGTTGPPAPTCDTYLGSDVWYKFVVPAGGSVTVTTTANTITDGAMSIYTATACNGVFTQVACNDNASVGNTMPALSVSCLTVGATIYVRFWKSGGGTGTFSICASTGPAVPGNDDPCAATVLTANATCINTASTNAGACNTAGVPVPSCGNYSGSDVWFKVATGAVGTLTISSTAGTMTDGAMALYTATACNGVFTEVSCNDNGTGMPQILLANQPAGTYYIRFWQAGGGNGTFSICATLVPPPANDDPCGATVLPVNASCVLSAGTTVGATNSAPANPSCANYNGSDVWYTVTLASMGTLVVSSTAGTITNSGMSLYTATACNGVFTEVTCDDDNGPGSMSQITQTCQAAGTYYVRFWQYGGGTGTFNICASFTAGPANDVPCSATVLTVNSTCSNTAGNNTNACFDSAPPASGCGNLTAASHDVWYRFTAPASGVAIIETTGGTLTDAAMALYSGACGALTLVSCDDDSGPGFMPYLFFNNLTPGNTYWIRYWGYGTNQGTYNICVHGPSLPVGYSCIYSLDMTDAGQDGWGTSNVSVSINGGASTAYTVTGTRDIFYIGVNMGDVIVFTYSNSGANQADNAYSIKLTSAAYPSFTSGSPPANGLSYFTTVNCVGPPASHEDCIGAKTICGGQSFNANPNGQGFVADLNASNYGCLASAERQGVWYIFKVSSGGNIGMTIDPTGPDDYDWAIWGNYPSNSTTATVCSPAAAPIRCSYASGPATFAATGDYNTGMGSAAYSAPRYALPSVAYSQGAGGNGWVSGLTATTGQVYLLYVSNYSQSGLSFTLSWQFSGGSSLDCTVLPVELLSLTADVEGQDIAVRWSTATEHNSDYFSVERSSDGEDFRPLAAIDAAGESQQRIDYQYTDTDPLKGANYYRLKQVDIDGQFVYTYMVVALMGRTDDAPLLFPNPVKGSLHIAFNMPVNGTAVADVLDASGRGVKQVSFPLERGQRTMDVDVAELGAGAYQLRLTTSPDAPSTVTHFIKE